LHPLRGRHFKQVWVKAIRIEAKEQHIAANQAYVAATKGCFAAKKPVRKPGNERRGTRAP
jgi:hypothetical protein